MVKPGVDLQHAITQRGRDPEYGADDREDIDGVADRAINAVADDRIKRRAQGQRQAMPIAEEGQNQRHDGVDRPGVQPPVEKGQAHGLFGRLDALGRADRRRKIVHNRFCHAEEHQADAHPR